MFVNKTKKQLIAQREREGSWTKAARSQRGLSKQKTECVFKNDNIPCPEPETDQELDVPV